LICGWIYDDAAGSPAQGIAPHTAQAQAASNWICPECGAGKENFYMAEI
jgi:rubredoxin